jgi:hypothetical protein
MSQPLRSPDEIKDAFDTRIEADRQLRASVIAVVLPQRDYVELADLRVCTAQRGQGFASRALAILIDLCGEARCPIHLTPSPLDELEGFRASMYGEELTAWCRRNAFTRQEGSELIRDPQWPTRGGRAVTGPGWRR